MPPRTRRRLPPQLQQAIRQLALTGLTPTEILRHLEARKGDLEKWACAVPSLRSVERVVAAMAAEDPSVPWRLADADALEPEDRRVVLGALAELVQRSEGRRTTLTNAEATWVARLYAVAPELPPWDLLRLAHEYLGRGKEPTDDLDVLLAFRPWRGQEAAERYAKIIEAGWLFMAQPAPRFQSVDDELIGRAPDESPPPFQFVTGRVSDTQVQKEKGEGEA